jgi:hypothetical protein
MVETSIEKLRSTGNAINWQRTRTGLRVQMLPLSYIEREQFAISYLAETLEQPKLGFDESNENEKQRDAR